MLTSLLTSLTLALTLQSVKVNAQTPKCEVPAILDVKTNVWKTHALHPTSLYRHKVEEAAAAIQNDDELKRLALKVGDIGTFLWINTPEDIQTIPSVANEVPCHEILGLVVNNLPYKDAISSSSYNITTEQTYQTLYLEPLARTLKSHPNTAFALIIEPNAFTSYFNASTNPNPFPHETNLVKSYRANIPSALRSLNVENAILYLDLGHGNALDWDRHRNATADAFLDVYVRAGRPAQLRGVAGNVANMNSWNASPGEFTPADDSRYIRPQNEQIFITYLSSAIQKRFPNPNNNNTYYIPNHAISDTSRNGVLGLRASWDEWCNVNDAGLGVRPSAVDEQHLDAFVWVKRPGESDGASTPGFDRNGVDCMAVSAVRPAPEKGVWFQSVFEMLVRNAHPRL